MKTLQMKTEELFKGYRVTVTEQDSTVLIKQPKYIIFYFIKAELSKSDRIKRMNNIPTKSISESFFHLILKQYLV